jgi:hypothetical protein
VCVPFRKRRPNDKKTFPKQPNRASRSVIALALQKSRRTNY